MNYIANCTAFKLPKAKELFYMSYNIYTEETGRILSLIVQYLYFRNLNNSYGKEADRKQILQRSHHHRSCVPNVS